MTMDKPGFLNAERRRECWNARDKYFNCITTNKDEESKCNELRKAFETSCPKIWVKHFVRRRDYLNYSESLKTEGFVATDNKDKS